MNDPNGMVYYDGEYHLFYQHNLEGIQWRHMSWGHAVSTDLVHWTHLPLAIPETDSKMTFSGSAVVEWQNSSGFAASDKPPLVAIYTAHYPNQRKQNQYIAYSNDRGRTWTPYGNNPVIDIGMADFRNPKVFWYALEEKWVMVTALSLERKLHFYASINLKDWEFLSSFGPSGNADGIWKCPDLFELKVENEPGVSRWGIQVDQGSEAIAGSSGGQYPVGHFDWTTFTPRPFGYLLAGVRQGLLRSGILVGYTGRRRAENLAGLDEQLVVRERPSNASMERCAEYPAILNPAAH